jgi:hypothetical protein
MKKLMFNNSDSDNDTEIGHTRSGKVFREVHLANLFKQNYGDEGFYSGEEVDLTEEEHSEHARAEKKGYEEPRREEPETSATVQTIEVSTITSPIFSTAISNQNSQNHQSTKSIVTSSSTSTQTGNLGSSMEDEMRLPIFRGDGSEDSNKHWFMCESMCNINNFTDEAVKRA